VDRWYKGNLHTHSFWSDGNDFPEMIADWFKTQGYNFLAFTEHQCLQQGDRWVSLEPNQGIGDVVRLCGLLQPYIDRFGDKWVERRTGCDGEEIRLKPLHEYRHLLEEPGMFMLMYGQEVDTVHPTGRHWVNVTNHCETLPTQLSNEGSAAAIQKVCKAASALSERTGRGSLVSLNHPNYVWNATAEDIAQVPDLRFIEAHTALNCAEAYGDADHASAERIWDVVLSLRLASGAGVVYGIATDDSHYYSDIPIAEHVANRAMHPGRAWVMVRSPRLTPESIISAMLRGDFYSSNGVTLRALDVEEREVHIAVEPVKGIRYITRFIGSKRGADMTSTPVFDPAGNPIHTTRQYSAGVGRVLSEIEGVEASFEFTGDELYVRAVVTSDAPHAIPTVPGEMMKAWTQPVMPPLPT
jgi:hypothetical protein